MSDSDQVSLVIRAVYDHLEEAVGLDAAGSEAFEAGHDTKAIVELLAAVTAKANCMAAEVIRRWEIDEDRKKQLIDHYAFLKESMLAEMLEQLDQPEGPADAQ